MLMTTAAGRPCLVITTRPCSRSSRSTTSDNWFFTSARGVCWVACVIAISAARSGRPVTVWSAGHRSDESGSPAGLESSHGHACRAAGRFAPRAEPTTRPPDWAGPPAGPCAARHNSQAAGGIRPTRRPPPSPADGPSAPAGSVSPPRKPREVCRLRVSMPSRALHVRERRHQALAFDAVARVSQRAPPPRLWEYRRPDQVGVRDASTCGGGDRSDRETAGAAPGGGRA